MGKLVKIQNKKCTFYLDGRSIFVVLNGTLSQKFVIQTTSFKPLDQYAYVALVDCIYKRKFIDTDALGAHITSKYRLVPTARNL